MMTYDKNQPFPAKVLENRRLSSQESNKEIRHVVVGIADSGLTYACGSSLGVFPRNNPAEVDAVLRALGATGDETVDLPQNGGPCPLRRALSEFLSLAKPMPKFLALLAQLAKDPAEHAKLAGLVAPEAKDIQASFLAERDFIDLLEEFPSARVSPQDLVANLRKLNPRLYSIASSPAMHPDEVHLTVGIVRYETNGRNREGVCSTFLADRVGQGSCPVFVASSHFGPPEDPAADYIMVGPGTGIAPFRSFLQDHQVKGKTGRTWLFFGDQRKAHDFIYADEFSAWQKSGVLTRLDCAWSRDQAQKIYVQDLMIQNGAELWSWLKSGASFFVCGDAKRMAKDVDAALHKIAETHGGMDAAAAVEYVKALKKEGRYQRDVY